MGNEYPLAMDPKVRTLVARPRPGARLLLARWRHLRNAESRYLPFSIYSAFGDRHATFQIWINVCSDTILRAEHVRLNMGYRRYS